MNKYLLLFAAIVSSADGATFSDVTVENACTLSGLTANTVPYLNGSKVITSSSVTPARLEFINDLQSSAQVQINSKVSKTGDTMTGPLVIQGASDVAQLNVKAYSSQSSLPIFTVSKSSGSNIFYVNGGVTDGDAGLNGSGKFQSGRISTSTILDIASSNPARTAFNVQSRVLYDQGGGSPSKMSINLQGRKLLSPTETTVLDYTSKSTALNSILPDQTGAEGKVLTSISGVGAWQTPAGGAVSLTSAHLLVGNGSNIATDVAVSGDMTMANTGAATVATVGLSTAAEIHAATLAANAAISSYVPSTIVKRGTSGEIGIGNIKDPSGTTRISLATGVYGLDLINGVLTKNNVTTINFDNATAARTSILPSQSGASGKYLTSNGTDVSFAQPTVLNNSSGTTIFDAPNQKIRASTGVDVASWSGSAITTTSATSGNNSGVAISTGNGFGSGSGGNVSLGNGGATGNGGGFTSGSGSALGNGGQFTAGLGVGTGKNGGDFVGNPGGSGGRYSSFITGASGYLKAGSIQNASSATVVDLTNKYFIGASIKDSSSSVKFDLDNSLIKSGATTVMDVSSSSSAINSIVPSQSGNSGKYLTSNGSSVSWNTVSSGSGDVVGPSSATDEAVCRYDGTTGKLIKDSNVTSDGNSFYIPGDLTVSQVKSRDNDDLNLNSYSSQGDSQTTPSADINPNGANGVSVNAGSGGSGEANDNTGSFTVYAGSGGSANLNGGSGGQATSRDASSSTSGAATGNNGGDANVSPGSGGQASIEDNGGAFLATGGNSGNISLNGQQGGQASSVAVAGSGGAVQGGNGSQVSISSGSGGNATTDDSVNNSQATGGNSQDININGGNGGDSFSESGVSQAGSGANIHLTPGNPGNATTNTGSVSPGSKGTVQVHGDLTIDGVVSASNLTSGTYGPTATSVSNLDSVSASNGKYMQMGSMFIFSGLFTADPTAPGSASFRLSLPVSSDLANAEDCSGTAVSGTISGMSAEIVADPTNDEALVQWVATDITSQTWSYTVQCVVQ